MADMTTGFGIIWAMIIPVIVFGLAALVLLVGAAIAELGIKSSRSGKMIRRRANEQGAPGDGGGTKRHIAIGLVMLVLLLSTWVLTLMLLYRGRVRVLALLQPCAVLIEGVFVFFAFSVANRSVRQVLGKLWLRLRGKESFEGRYSTKAAALGFGNAASFHNSGELLKQVGVRPVDNLDMGNATASSGRASSSEAAFETKSPQSRKGGGMFSPPIPPHRLQWSAEAMDSAAIASLNDPLSDDPTYIPNDNIDYFHSDALSLANSQTGDSVFTLSSLQRVSGRRQAAAIVSPNHYTTSTFTKSRSAAVSAMSPALRHGNNTHALPRPWSPSYAASAMSPTSLDRRYRYDQCQSEFVVRPNQIIDTITGELNSDMKSGYSSAEPPVVSAQHLTSIYRNPVAEACSSNDSENERVTASYHTDSPPSNASPQQQGVVLGEGLKADAG